MSRAKQAARTRMWIVAGVMSALAAGAVGWIVSDTLKARREEAEAARILPVLPAGRLQHLYDGVTETSFLALDTVRKAGAMAEASVVVVGKKGDSLEGGGAVHVLRRRVDCSGERVFDVQTAAFDIDGKLISAAPGYGGRHGRPAETADHEVGALCKGEAGRIVADWKAALRATQAPPDDLAKRAAAHPDDAHAWAWLCAAAARGTWRAKAPGDCARALKLTPDDAALRMDLALLFVKIGRWREADQEFAYVLKRDPRNAVALFGRSLSDALQQDEAASRRDRRAALDLDEGVADWVAHTYNIQMSREYRVR